MNKTKFWKIIDESCEVSNDDIHNQPDVIVDLLQNYTAEEIIEFEKILRELIIEADTFDVMGAYKIIEGWVTDDPYLYFRCWLISRGSKLFQEVVQNPDYLADYQFDASNVELEELLYVTTDAFRKKTGKTTEDESFPRSIALVEGIDYDHGAPETKGTDWEEEDLPVRLPKLWRKFNGENNFNVSGHI